MKPSSLIPRPSRRWGLWASLAALGLAQPVWANPAPAAPANPPAAQSSDTAVAAQWQTPLPHAGQGSQLVDWWQRLGSPVLGALVNAAQEASPDVAGARQRWAQAQALWVGADANGGPQWQASAGVVRTRPDLASPPLTQASLGLTMSWEWDVWNGQGAAQRAAQQRLQGAQATWHDARVSTAATTAQAYFEWRFCDAQARWTEAQAASARETARLNALAQKAGALPAVAAQQADAAARQFQVQALGTRAQCDRAIKALVALTAWEEPALRQRLAAEPSSEPAFGAWALAVPSVPGQALAQRPDVAAAARELEATAADVSQRHADRYPRVAFNGSLSAAALRSGALSLDGSLWSIGPLQVSLPLWDGGQRRANLAAAQTRYDAQRVIFQGKVRQAVSEVEDALVRLQSAEARRGEWVRILASHQQTHAAVVAREKVGAAARLEVEEAQRALLQAQMSHTDVLREQVTAWIALYRALGGGWTADAQAPVLSSAR